MKKLIVSILTVVLLVVNTTSIFAAPVEYGAEYTNQQNKQYKQTFTDLPSNHWAFEYIMELVDKGTISGYPDKMFRPNRQVTRAEFAKLIVTASGLPVKTTSVSSFYDVKTTDWYSPFIESAKSFLTGYNMEGRAIYNPNTSALREDIAIALVKLKGYDVSIADESIIQAMFTDYDGISSYAKRYVAVAVERGLISGYDDQTFRPQSSITRAEVATMLWRASRYGNDNKIDADETENLIRDEEEIVYQPQVSEKVEYDDVEFKEEEEVKSYTYTIDTMAEVSAMVTSMVTDNKNVLHYVVNDKVYNTNGDKLNMDNLTYEGPYDYSVDLVHLAYDEYNNILYLIANDYSDRLVIFDITDYDNPKAIMNKFNAKKIDDLSVSLSYPYGGPTMRRVEVLQNGSLVLSSVESDVVNVHEYSKHDYKLMVNLENMSFSRYEKSYDIPEQIYINPLNRDIGNNIVRKNDRYYFWDDQGYAMIDKQGEYHVLAGIEDIESLDYKAVGRFNIWNTTVDDEDSFIFYDNTDMCIRKISKK